MEITKVPLDILNRVERRWILRQVQSQKLRQHARLEGMQAVKKRLKDGPRSVAPSPAAAHYPVAKYALCDAFPARSSMTAARKSRSGFAAAGTKVASDGTICNTACASAWSPRRYAFCDARRYSTVPALQRTFGFDKCESATEVRSDERKA